MSKQLEERSRKQKNSLVASKESEVVRKVMPLMNLNEDYQRRAFMEALKRFNVTEKELEDGFWAAYADHFTPASGIEFRHIFKHVQKNREEKPFDSEKARQFYGVNDEN